MKSRSSSPPILVHANESTPVRVHIQKPKLLPSVVEKGPTRRVSITLGGTENNSSVIHSSDVSFDEESNINKQVYRCGLQIDSLMEDLESLKNELSGHVTNEQLEDGLSASNWITEECGAEAQELSRTTDKIRTFKESFEKLQKELDLRGLEKENLGEENMLLTALKEAEMASISTAEQVAALKNSIVELIQVNQLSASGVGRFAGVNDLLLEKLENFKIANQKLQYLLRDLWNPEPCVNCTNRQMGVLTQKLTRSETENIHLKRKLLDVERNAKEFSEQYQTEKDNSCFVKQLSKSVEATQVRLQEQLKNKEAKNNRMSVQIQKFEKTVIDRKLQIAHLRSQLPALKGKAEVDEEVLKKAARAQKRRAERFEAAVENLNSQIKDKDLKLSETRLTVDTWKKQHDLAVEEKAQLETEIISLSNRVAGLKEQLQSSAERSRSTSHDLLGKLHNSNLENSNLRLENAQLRVSLTALEEKASTTTAELEQLKAEAKQQKEVVLQYETQVSEVKDQAVAQECALQSKVHSLESELNRKTKELKQLQRNKNNAEMSHKTHLQELKLSLEQSESGNQNIQNYVQFLKMSYAVMFGDSTLTEFQVEPSLR
ncbi:outer dense fiber protein 2-like isoform X3 [Cetorhinus maximus]